MKFRKMTLALALLLLTAVASAAQENKANPGASGGPKMVIASFTHDFGEVKPGLSLSYSFKIKNAGKEDLLIKSVTPG